MKCKYPYNKDDPEDCDKCGFCDDEEEEEEDEDTETTSCGIEYEEGYEADCMDACARCGLSCPVGALAQEEDEYEAGEALFNELQATHSKMTDKARGYWPVEPTKEEMREYIVEHASRWVAIPHIRRLRARAGGYADPPLMGAELREGVLYIIEADFNGDLA